MKETIEQTIEGRVDGSAVSPHPPGSGRIVGDEPSAFPAARPAAPAVCVLGPATPVPPEGSGELGRAGSSRACRKDPKPGSKPAGSGREAMSR